MTACMVSLLMCCYVCQLEGLRCTNQKTPRRLFALWLWSQATVGNLWAVALSAATAALCLFTRLLLSQWRRINCRVTSSPGPAPSAAAWSDSLTHIRHHVCIVKIILMLKDVFIKQTFCNFIIYGPEAMSTPNTMPAKSLNKSSQSFFNCDVIKTDMAHVETCVTVIQSSYCLL